MAELEERTEQATPRRREKAREKGQVARSRELTTMAGAAGTILLFYFAGDSFVTRVSELMGRLLGLQCGREPLAVMKSAASELFLLLMPILGMSFTLALAAGFAQGGIVFKAPALELDKISPIAGFRRLFSISGLGEFVKSLLKLAVGGVVSYFLVKKAIVIVPLTAAMDLTEIRKVAANLISKSVLSIFMTFLVIALADYIYQRWKHERSLRMTKEEIREEFKESEGDPHIKSRIRSLQREMARRRMMQEVPKATVVITNPTHLAVALSYKNDEMSAPKIVAKGAGIIAEKMRETARKHGVPLVEDKPLARALYKLDINSLIPEELYKAVAKILAYVYKLRGAA
ncbi:MAG TPA: flagellar biosynthesis protein FlhB [Thermodesulfovibrionales bacterium]|nr:flagellar biosynthesis protein FlhB [Thermodesulfovibrionales bacterium]